MKANLMNKFTRSFNKVGFVLKKHSPEILVGVGIVTGVASAVTACKATIKAIDVLDDAKEKIDTINKVANDETLVDSYSEEDHKKDLTIAYVQTGVELLKVYGPSLALGAVSIGSILASNNIMKKRNVAIAAAFATVDESFKEYRGRVIERFGERIDKELKYNIKAKEIEKTTIDENGTETTTKEVIDVVEPGINKPSEFAKFFDEGSRYWEKNPEFNMMFLKRQEDYANDKLRLRGYLFLNEVYDMLGIPQTKAGQIVGWTYDEKCPNGDNYVDFGIFNVYDSAKRDFVNGYEPRILLDFNVDGNILELM